MSIKVDKLKKVYGNGYPAVGGVSFGVGKNEVVGLLGPNGAGKSTTFSVLTMELPKSSGDVQVMNMPTETFDNNTYAPMLGLAAQSNVIWDHLTVDEHLNFICRVKGLNQQDIEF